MWTPRGGIRRGEASKDGQRGLDLCRLGSYPERVAQEQIEARHDAQSRVWGPALGLLGLVLGAIVVFAAQDDRPCMGAASRCSAHGGDVGSAEPTELSEASELRAADDLAFDDTWGSLGP